MNSKEQHTTGLIFANATIPKVLKKICGAIYAYQNVSISNSGKQNQKKIKVVGGKK